MSWWSGAWAVPRKVSLQELVSQIDSIGTTTTNGISLVNSAPAAAGAQQISPRLHFTGQGWKTDAPAGSQTVDWIAELVPVQGAANPQARLDFSYQINGGGYAKAISFLNDKISVGSTTIQNQFYVSSTDADIIAWQRTSSRKWSLSADGNGGYLRNTTDATIPIYLSNVGNIGFNVTSFGASAVQVISFGGPATAPITRPADVFTVYPIDVSGAGTMGLAWMSEDNGIGIFGSRVGIGTMGPNGQLSLGMGDGQQLQFDSLTELTTIAAAASTATAIQIPLNAVVLAVSVRVTTVIPTAATFTVTGTSSSTAFNTTAVSTAANSTDLGTAACPYKNGAAQTITITPNVQPAANTGRVRVTIHYYTVTPATS